MDLVSMRNLLLYHHPQFGYCMCVMWAYVRGHKTFKGTAAQLLCA